MFGNLLLLYLLTQPLRVSTETQMRCPSVRDLVVNGQWAFSDRFRGWSLAAAEGSPGPQPYLDSVAWVPNNEDFNIQCWYLSADENGSLTIFRNENSTYSSRLIRILSNISCDLAQAPTWTQAVFFGDRTHDYSCSPGAYNKGQSTDPLCFWEPLPKGVVNITLPECPVRVPVNR